MHSIRIQGSVNQMISFFYFIGVWHRGDKPTVRELRIKVFYSLYYPLLAVSSIVGAIGNENRDESIFLSEISVGVTVLAIKLWFLIWKQNEILDLMSRICVFPIRDDEDFTFVKNKLRKFTNITFGFVIAFLFCVCCNVLVIPFLGSEKTLFLKIGFPLDWRNNEIAFWIATIFTFTEYIMSVTIVCFSVLIWYLLFDCSLRYEVLGNDIRRMGPTSEENQGKISDKQKHCIFLQDLTTLIAAHIHLRELVSELEFFVADLFLVQFGTSGLCICGSIYCLAFDISDNLLERFSHIVVFSHFISELLMITYFGNEIKLSSNRLSYSLFESHWIDQPQSTKKCIIIFGEYLKQPQELLVGKLYPLTLETFTKILNSAYSMFNILKSFQQ